jgi:hypothetical protein
MAVTPIKEKYMKNRIGVALGLVCLALSIFILLSGPVAAQQPGMRVDVPVPFLAGNTIFPAGSYVVRLDERFRILEIQGQHAVEKVMMTGKSTRRPAAKAEKGMISFQRYGENYVLRNVWRRDDTDGWALVRSQKEKELAAAYTTPAVTLIAEAR